MEEKKRLMVIVVVLLIGATGGFLVRDLVVAAVGRSADKFFAEQISKELSAVAQSLLNKELAAEQAEKVAYEVASRVKFVDYLYNQDGTFYIFGRGEFNYPILVSEGTLISFFVGSGATDKFLLSSSSRVVIRPDRDIWVFNKNLSILQGKECGFELLCKPAKSAETSPIVISANLFVKDFSCVQVEY